MRTILSVMMVTTSALVAAGAAVAGPTVPDNGSGTADLPAVGVPYRNQGGQWNIIDGLPPGTTFRIDTELTPLNLSSSPPYGSWQVDSFFDVFTELSMDGTGTLGGYHRDITLPTGIGRINWGPRSPGLAVQSITADWFQYQTQITGDPDFDLLRITAGSGFGLPSPGHTTLTQVGGGNWAVDSFFDITYRIDFVGRPGGALAGMSGSTTGTIRMEAVPEPATAGLLLVAGGAALARRRRR